MAVAISPVAGRAEVIAPHDRSFTDGDCENCHNLYDSTTLGGADFSGGCNACHATRPTSTLAFPRAEAEAKPGVKGTHHSWSGFAENPAVGATKPQNPNLAKRLIDGRLQCSVCHDLHAAAASNAPDSVHASPGVGVATLPTAGTGGARLTITTAGTLSRGYRVKLVTGTTYIVSRSFGATPIQWMNWEPATSRWVPGVDNGFARTLTPGTPQLIDPNEPTGPSISLNIAGEPGDTWDLLVSYPGLRATTENDYDCTECHKSMAMNYRRVAGADMAYPVDGTRTFGHPVGDALNANGLNTDRAQILDADGRAQTTGDGNVTNDLRLKAGVVRCTTCHAVHGADSNSLTTDVR